MSTRVVEEVDSWDSRPFEDGYRELHDLADREFSGVVRADGAELYMTKGSVVGVRNGTIENFSDATGTVYDAPSPALPLLAVMQERSDEVRAKYYTEETGISTVDRKLSDGNFTGYIELAENVLSGDYYLVYHQGHSMSVAYLGEAARLADGDDAFQQADDEVGIYEVRPVDIEPVEIPEPSESAAGAATTGEADVEDTEAAPESETSETDDESGGSTDAAETESENGDAKPEESAETGEEAAEGDAESDDSEADSAEGSQSRSETARESGGDDDNPELTENVRESSNVQDSNEEREEPPQRTESGRESEPDTAREEGQGTSRQSETQQPQNTGQATSDRRSDATVTDSRALETRAIPSLDPDRTETPSTASTASSGSSRSTGRQRGRSQQSRQNEERTRSQSQREPVPESEPDTPTKTDSQSTTADEAESVARERIAELETEIDSREEQIEELESELDSVSDERETLQRELTELKEERDELESTVERLETELERLETEFGAATDAERRMTPLEALEGTDVFIRYESKGDATLAKAHDGGVRRSDVDDNLRLEKHTQFDADAVAVGGQTFEEFLEDTLEFQFVEWIIYELLFEIRDTGHADQLRDLFDAIPNIDRAELNGAVNVVYSEEGQETRSTEAFDVVLRDRMGDPLLVANLNDSREAATEGDMENLVTAAERVGQTSEDFAAAFLITRSFFEPGALETASEATRGGILSRDKRTSFVNLSRKRGYHLCLVEARNRNFNLAVPEL